MATKSTRAPVRPAASRARSDASAFPPRGQRPTIVAPIENEDLRRRLAQPSDLGDLLIHPPVMESAATTRMDGRMQPMALIVGRESDGRPLVGALARLFEGDDLVDESRFDIRGLALVKFPMKHSMRGDKPQATRSGRIEILAPGHETVKKDVSVPTHASHKIVDVTLRVRRMVPVDGDATHAAVTSRPPLPPTDNVLDRLPAEFDTRLCRDLQSFFTQTPTDPVTGIAGAPQLLPAPSIPGMAPGAPDFRQQRLPIVKRFAVVRQGRVPAPIRVSVGPKAMRPRRYVVRMRQEWIFLGYSLGPLARVDALDPGTIVQDVTRTVDNAIQMASREVDRAIQNASRDVDSTLRQRASLDNVVKVATSTSAGAAAGGFFIGIPGLFGIGGGGGVAEASATVTTTTKTDATLEVSNALHVATSVINEATSAVEATRRELQNAVTRTVGQVSPLLTRVTNLLRWNLLENYLVCTHVEDVLELTTATIAELPDPATGLLFTAEQIVDLTRVFKPGLLEPRLAPRFDTLAEEVDAERGEGAPVTAIDVTVEYSSPASFASLSVSVNGSSTGFELVPGGSVATRTIYPATPVTGTLVATTMTLALGMSPDATQRAKPGVQIARVELAFRTAAGQVRRAELGLGSLMLVDEDHLTRTLTRLVSVPQPTTHSNADPLVAHVNANRAHYFALLCNAALHEPALRDDMPHFAAFRADHPLWGLPIIGFEGNRAVIVRPADVSLDEVKEMLADPGTATLVQLAVPGAYAEALQGLLQLAIGEGLHPDLHAPLPPVMPPLAVVDLTGKLVPLPLPTTGGGTTAPVEPLPLPTPP